MVTVEFLVHASPYNIGEMAEFPKERADKLVADGVVKIVKVKKEAE